MTGRTSFIVAAEAGASNPAYPTSIIAPSSPEVQYPEPAKQSPTWRYHSDVLPPPLPKEILSSRPNNGIQPSRHMLAGPTVSTRSSTSSGSRQESIHNGRQTTLPIDSAPDTRSLSHQERYVGFTSTFLHDPEKASPVRYPPSDRPHTSDAFSTYISEEEKDTKEHTVWILVYLSFFSPIVATCISIYTITTVLLLLLLLPVLCLCKPCKPLKQQFHKYLAPPSHFQLSLVCSPPESDTYRFKPEESHVENKGNTLLLIAISILSPLYAAGIAVMAWVAAGFWATSIILGNPDGKDGKDDGKAVVLGVRGLWVRWLRRGLR